MKDPSQVQQLFVPTPAPINPVSLYAINSPDGYFLIDGGVSTDDARKLIKEWLPRPLAGILITHSHADHMGLVGELAREHHCPVFLAAEEMRRLQKPEDPRQEYGPVLHGAGVTSAELSRALEAVKEIRRGEGVQLHDVEIIRVLPRQTFTTDLGTLEVIPTPGHSAGHCCYYLPDHAFLFSGDHILADISPNPVLDIGPNGQRRKAFVEYLESLQQVLTLPISWVFPGHGRPFSNLSEIYDRFRTFMEVRGQAILDTLTDEAQTPFQIAQKIYPGLEGLDILLGISKVWGQIDVLELQGKIKGFEAEGIHYCHK